ncbi:hypothetical protein [Brachybacterium timonense]|uniref:hypothetical protein n=1 Tax=Brachybacterium timonense TaxID=2050896 RepID=UPI000D0B7F8F|nr:hypothetical protein [Brachybacterium timonense]
MSITQLRPNQTASRTTGAALRRLDADLAALERAEQILCHAESQDGRDAFELAHRAALRIAGVVISRANRSRRRPLPLNVWAALSRLGGEHARRAEECEPFVRERALLDREERREPDADLIARHCAGTREHLRRVRELCLADIAQPVVALAS